MPDQDSGLPGLLSGPGLGSLFACSAFGRRNDNRAMAMVTAATRTASPASCPPIRRESSGTTAAALAAWTVFGLTFGRPSDPGVLLPEPETVGKRLAGLPGDTAGEPGIAGTVAGPGSVTPGCGLVPPVPGLLLAVV